MRTAEEIFEKADEMLIRAAQNPNSQGAANIAAVAQAHIFLGISIRHEEDADDSEDSQRD